MNTTSSPRKDKIVYNTEEKKNEEPTEEVIESLIPQVGTFARLPRGVSTPPDLSFFFRHQHRARDRKQ